MTIAPHLFEAFLKCPTKCYLRSLGETGSGNEYADWVKTQAESYRRAETERVLGEMPDTEVARSPSADTLRTAKWRLAAEVTIWAPHKATANRSADSLVRACDVHTPLTGGQSCPRSGLRLETRLHAIERIPSAGRGKAAQFVPIRFIWRNKLTKDDKLLLAFDAFALGQALGRDIAFGKIIHGDPPDPRSRARESADHLEENTSEPQIVPEPSAFSRTRLQPQVLRVKTSALAGEVRKLLDKIAALLSCPPGDPSAEHRSADSLVRATDADATPAGGLGSPRSCACFCLRSAPHAMSLHQRFGENPTGSVRS